MQPAFNQVLQTESTTFCSESKATFSSNAAPILLLSLVMLIESNQVEDK